MSELLQITIGDLLDQTAARYPEKEALVYTDDRNLRLTYAQFRQKADEVAKGLMALGVQKGEHIALWATNYPEWLYTQFGSAKMGAVLVTVNTNYRSFELEYLLRQSDATTLFLIDGFRDNNFVEIINELCPGLGDSEPGRLSLRRLPKLKNIIFIGRDPQAKHPGMYSWQELIDMGRSVSDAELAERQRSLHFDEVINMQYTSGTTGFPKGVMLSHANIINNANMVADCQKWTHEDRLCFPVPLFHCFGCVMSSLACVCKGATMVPLEYFTAKGVLEAVQRERCTVLYGVPTMFIAELDHPDFDKYDLSSLRTGIMAGSPCPIEVMRKVIDRMGIGEITIAYGQTEFSPVITQTRTDDSLERRVCTVGKALPHVEVKIVHPDTGLEIPRGTQGELCARGFGTMKGYYNNPEATEAAIDAEGWLHTGDLATMDEEGYCRITGRAKDMIIRGGENIYPREVEEFLFTHPKVKDVQVVGVPDPKYGEEALACIILKDGEEATEEEIRYFCRGKISRYKIPKYVRFVDHFPMTASGKIQKFKLREIFIKELGLEDAAKIETA
ncbi:long chain fatty acid acyl-coa ligase [Heliomicrobium modesticaldum Ice1]|uniref:Long chain fatty acid acyl-coa ligase n=1 Tax=Heliobacterium modesticaldum (strain ATCC 51547 / Ice1) TaxID=498761 RepID=B0TI45_HELMI|nr:AMP-binding protein [Heliomicrobium modesticaldum]ABZ82718.1 long chain fatty acid acyl-coa ligase [Heliomicrobium modesticaldum Ice1]